MSSQKRTRLVVSLHTLLSHDQFIKRALRTYISASEKHDNMESDRYWGQKFASQNIKEVNKILKMNKTPQEEMRRVKRERRKHKQRSVSKVHSDSEIFVK